MSLKVCHICSTTDNILIRKQDLGLASVYAWCDDVDRLLWAGDVFKDNWEYEPTRVIN